MRKLCVGSADPDRYHGGVVSLRGESGRKRDVRPSGVGVAGGRVRDRTDHG